jgi:RecA-family ATPase
MTLPSRDFYKELWNKGVQAGELQLHTERMGNLLKVEFPPEVWVVDQLLPDESVTVLSGAPGSFKTWLYMEIAVKVAKGEQVFGHFKSKQTGVLVIDEESGERRLQKRFKQLGVTEELPIHYLSRIGYKLNQLYANAIAQKARELGTGLIIFDSFTRFNTGDENASGDMSTYMDYYRQLADAGFSVLILHHNRKEVAGKGFNPAQAMRGSSDILASADCHIAVSRKGQSENVKLEQTKNRDIWEPAPFELHFYENANEFEYVGKDKTDAELHRERLNIVKNYVEKHPGQYKTELLKFVKSDTGIDVGQKKIGELLEELVANEELEMEFSDHNGYKYFLATNGGIADSQ